MKAEDETRRAKIPTGISTIDEITDGGIPRQDTVLLIMRSGVGKSTALKYFLGIIHQSLTITVFTFS